MATGNCALRVVRRRARERSAALSSEDIRMIAAHRLDDCGREPVAGGLAAEINEIAVARLSALIEQRIAVTVYLTKLAKKRGNGARAQPAHQAIDLAIKYPEGPAPNLVHR